MKLVNFVAVAFAVGLASSAVIGLAARPRPAMPVFTAAVLPCGQGDQGAIAVVARTQPSLAMSTSKTGRVVDAGVGDGNLHVVFSTVPGSQLAVDISSVRVDPAVIAAGPVLGVTSDPRFLSCHYRLADNAKALDVARRATNRMLSSGLLTPADLGNDATTYLLTDDPTDAARLLFFVVLRQPDTPAPVKTVGAEIDRASTDILSVGAGNIYAATP